MSERATSRRPIRRGATGQLVVTPVAPGDRPGFEAWHAAYLAAELVQPDVASPWRLEEWWARFTAPATRFHLELLVGAVAGRVVVTGYLQAPLLDNLERAEVAVHTTPGERRRGFGSAMLSHLEARCRGLGRRVLVAETVWPHAAGAGGAGEPGPEFARRHGFTLALDDVKRELALPVDEALLDALATEAAPHHAPYTLRSWVGPVPDELLDGWARLVGSLVVEAPTGGLEVEPEHVDVAVVREQEALAARQGRTKYNTVALDAAGDVVAYTDVATTLHEPGRAYQWGTLVRRADRGHRLGLAVKVANLQLLQRECPGLRAMVTYNAEVNAAMIGVNERLGFVPVARLGEHQKHLS